MKFEEKKQCPKWRKRSGLKITLRGGGNTRLLHWKKINQEKKKKECGALFNIYRVEDAAGYFLTHAGRDGEGRQRISRGKVLWRRRGGDL